MIDRKRPFIAGLLALLLCVAPAVAQSNDDPALVERYRAAWMEAERAAKTESQRAELADELLTAARAAAGDDAAYAVFIARRAYLMGSAQRASYATAADALELMTDIDPTLKLEALEKVRDLYQLAYRDNPTVNLGLGMKAAEATALVARERQRALDRELSRGRVGTSDVLIEANKITIEWGQARRTASAVINSARSIHRSLTARQAANAELVATFIADHENDIDHYEAEMMRASRYKDAAVSLNQAQGKLDRDPDDAEAKAEIGRLYLLVFDAPALARPHAAAFLDGEQAVLLNLAAEPDAELTTEQRLTLAQMYAELAPQASGELGQRRGLTKARALLADCDEAFAAEDERYAAAEKLAEEVGRELVALGVAAAPLALAPKPTTVALADPAPSTETRDPFADDDIWGKPAEPDSQTPAADNQQGTGIVVAADPRTHEEKPTLRDSFNDSEDDAYWASREKSIFDFGRDD